MSSEFEHSAVVESDHDGMRIDRYVSDVLGLFPRSQLANRDAEFQVNGRAVKPSRRVSCGDAVTVRYREPIRANIVAEPVEINVIYEDNDVVVIDKPQGMVVHPAAGNWSGTLAQGLMHRLGGGAEQLGGEHLRPGIVHRLDKDTSGVLIAAKNPETLERLAEQFRNRSVSKLYLAVVKGRPPGEEGTVRAPIGRDPSNRKRFAVVANGGKRATTSYRVLRKFGDYAFVALEPSTGRTHQLRVHMHSLNCPILGDPIYARSDPDFPRVGLMLHAYRLSITLPASGARRSFTARLPERFRAVLRALGEDRSE